MAKLKLNHELISKLLTVEVANVLVARFFIRDDDFFERPGEAGIRLAH